MLKLILLSLLPIVCNGRIKIDIIAASDKTQAKVKPIGNDMKTITEKEIHLFNITKERLTNGVRIELGRWPQDVFLTDPTTYDDLFEQFHWQPVTRKMVIEEAKILDIINEPVLLKENRFINNTTLPLNYNIGIFETVEQTVDSNWSKTGFPDDDLDYIIKIHFKSMNKSIEYYNKWRNGTLRSIYQRFGVSKPGHVSVKSGQEIKTSLYCLKTIMLVKITYVASLTGCVIADFEELEGIHYHFFSPTVKAIMRAANIYNEIRTTEEIVLRFYTDPKLEVTIDSKEHYIEIVTPPNPVKNMGKKTIWNKRGIK